jgi:6-phosphogluconolactonase
VATGSTPAYLAFDPSNQYAYVANYTLPVVNAPMNPTISQYTVDASGQLTPMATPTVAAGAGPGWIAFDAFGHYAYVVNLGYDTSTVTPGTVSEYAIGTGGALTLIGTVAVGMVPRMMATTY